MGKNIWYSLELIYLGRGLTRLPRSHCTSYILGKSITILNDVKLATDMPDKKSRIYSNRPNLIMGGKPVDGTRALPSFNSGRSGRNIVVSWRSFWALGPKWKPLTVTYSKKENPLVSS